MWQPTITKRDKMKTVLIYDQFGQEPIKFAVLDGDYSRFNGAYVNSCDGNGDELGDLLYPDDTGVCAVEFVDAFPVDAVKEGAIVVVCGFLP